MYNNSGAKVKGLASFFAGLGMAGSILFGVVSMIAGRGFGGIFGGVLIAAVGCLASWLSGLVLAAFGELVQNTYEILQILKEGKPVRTGPLAPAEVNVKVSEEEIAYVAKRDNLPYVEAVIQAKKEKAAQPETVSEATAVLDRTVPLAAATTEQTQPLERICPNCGAVNAGGKFCFKCGTKL